MMLNMNVPLSEHWQRFVAEQVRTGRFPSEAAVLEEALALLKRQERGPVQQKAPNGTGPSSTTITSTVCPSAPHEQGLRRHNPVWPRSRSSTWSKRSTPPFTRKPPRTLVSKQCDGPGR